MEKYGWGVGRSASRRFKNLIVKPSLPEGQEQEPEAFPDGMLNSEVKDMGNITGARGLAGAFKDRLAAARQKIAQADENMQAAMDNLEKTAEQAEGLVREIEREAADLQASLGTVSNGGPSVDD